MIFNFYCVGNVGSEANLRNVGDTQVCAFSVACNERYKDSSGQDKEITHWVTVEAWGGFGASLANKVKKGMFIAIEGKPKADSWIDKETGESRSKLVVRAKEVRFDGRVFDENGVGNEDNDIPF